MQNSLWLVPRFFTYALGNIVNNFGNSIYLIVMPLYIFSLTGSILNMSLMAIVEVLPQILFSMFIGTVVDRYSRRTVIFASLIFQSLCCVGIYILSFSNSIELWIIYILGFCLSVGQIFLRTAQFAIIPKMFPERKAEASASISSIYTLTNLLGPLVVGVLILYVDYDELFLINALTFIVPIFMSIWSRIPHDSLGGFKSKEQVIKDMKFGFNYIFNSKMLLNLLFIVSILKLVEGGLINVVIYYLKEDLSLADQYISWILIASGVGSFSATLFPSRFNSSPGRKLPFYLLVTAIGNILLVIPVVWMIPISLMISAIGSRSIAISYNVLIQEIVPDNLLGRVGGSMRTLYTLAYPISFIFLGMITEFVGAKVTFALVGILSFIPLFISIKTRETYSIKEEDKPSIVH